ncbi:MAG: GMC family oxidoreductase [Gammaproteobacteria bacterium]|nr:GMC family oxidoreductase [Gammaproteobacteria bacterium]
MAGRDECDVCVIGTGAGGGVMIKELSEAGFSVVALERGPLLTPSDFTDDELGVVVRREIFGDQLETSRIDDQSPTQIGRINGSVYCVGGTITHWSAWSWRFRPEEFRIRSVEGPIAGASLADWPISYDDMEPFYEKAEWEFGVSGDAEANRFGPPRKRAYPNPPHPIKKSSQSFVNGAEKLGYHPFHGPTAINSRAYRGRPQCSYGGTCAFFGCPIHAKATSLSVCIPKALASGNLDLRPNAMVHQITIGADGRARSVRYLDEAGAGHEVFARQVVVSGGAFGSPHLLLNSTSPSFPDGLANSSGLVGKNLTLHLFPLLQYLVDEPTLGMTGINLTVAVDDLHDSDSKRGFIRGGVFGEATTSTPISHAMNAYGFPNLKQMWGRGFKDYLRTFPRQVAMIGFLEDLPVETNRVDLDPDVKDGHGLPVPRITHKQHANDLAMMSWYTDRMREIGEAAGAVDSWVPDAPFTNLTEKKAMPGAAGHFHGTCRMGDNPKSSVVDRWCRSHDVKNLWVVDGSFFPTSGGYNPTLTILANAYRVANHFIAEAKRLNL